MYELELGTWGDGTIRLYFEDSLHGNDRVFILDADGRAYEAFHDGDDERREPVDLVSVLRLMAQTPRKTD